MGRFAAVVTVSCACIVTSVATAPPRQLGSGLDLASFDRSVRPQDDLYRFVNGGWLDRAPIPADRVVYTVATELQERVEHDLRAIIEALVEQPDTPKGSAARQIADLYTSMVDTTRIEALGASPLTPELTRIDDVRTTSELAAVAGHLSATSTSGPFFGTVALDPRTGDRVVHLSQGGTLLPNREYYLSAAGEFPRIRREYRSYLAHVFTLVGRPRAAADAEAVVALETDLARAQWTQVDSRDPSKTLNPFTLRRLAEEMPGFDWRAWAEPQGLDRVGTIFVAQPSFFRHFAAQVPRVALETWKAWLAARYITATAPYVSEAFTVARFEFFGRTLTGQQEHRPRWRRGVGIVSETLGDELGRLYVEKHFPASSRTRVRKIVEQLIAAYSSAIRDADWMSSRAKGEALDKLSALSSKIGYPDRWRDYRGLEIDAGDLIGNVTRARQFADARRLARVDRPDDRGEWLITPQTVNAYYRPAANEIVFPAAMLQPPYFNAGADDAVNYGAIGAVIGHEIGHALDDRGRYFDGRGAVRDWWTDNDAQAYGERTRVLVEQFNGYKPLPGAAVNGRLTLAENAGDLAGLTIAYRAYQRSLDGRPPPSIDGFTGAQRFFLGWARIWRTQIRAEYQRQMLLNSPYSPASLRANGPVGHLSGFYDAFAVTPGDRLYRAPAARARIW